MSSVETYPAAPPERIGVTYVIDGVLSGAGVWLDITRKSVAGASDAAEILDWDDDTFKAIGAAGTPIVSVPAVVGRTGDYRLDWDVGAIVNAVAGGDEYKVRFYSDAGGTVAIGSAEIRTRNVDAINANTDAAASPLATSVAVAAVKADTAQTVDALYNARDIDENGGITQYADNGVTPAYTGTATDVNGDPVTIAAGSVARTTKLTAVP